MMKLSAKGKQKQFNPQKILVIRLSAIGDAVRTAPAVSSIRNTFPNAEIHWLIEDRCADILDGFCPVDRLKQVPRRLWQKTGILNRIRLFFRFLRELRKEDYDLTIDFHGILKSGLYGWASGCPRRVGYPKPIAREWNTLFTNEKISGVPPGRISRYQRNFLMAQYFDPSAVEENPGLPISVEERETAAKFFAKYGIGQGTAVFIYPGTSEKGRYKRWPPERFGKLSDLIQLKLQLPVVVGWGPGEEEIIDRLLAAANEVPIVLPPTTMKELAAFIGDSRVFIGGDTGPMHIASLMGTPVITVFGPSDPLINEPARFTPFRIVSAAVECAPCRNKQCRHLTCLTSVTPQMVMDALKELLLEQG